VLQVATAARLIIFAFRRYAIITGLEDGFNHSYAIMLSSFHKLCHDGLADEGPGDEDHIAIHPRYAPGLAVHPFYG